MKVSQATIVTCVAIAVLGIAHGSDLTDLVHKEVAAILADAPLISVADCTQKCDDMFGLLQDHDEEMTDKMCARQCNHALMTTIPGQTNHHGHHHHTTPVAAPTDTVAPVFNTVA